MAALPPAGVDLQAQNFSEYIRKLDAIEKKNREVFDAEFKGTGRTFTQVTKAAKDYERQLKQTNDAQRKAAQEAKKLAVAQKTARAAQQQAFISAGQAALSAAQQIGQFVVETSKIAAQFRGQQTGLQNLAASFGQSGDEIQAAIQTAAKGTVSGLDAIQAANLGLLLGVAKTPEQFSELTNTALTLGRTLGLTGTQAIEQFTTALGRQSLLILDNFGISAKQVNAEIERLAQADFGVARSQLTDAQKQATFMKAALQVAGEAAASIGEEAGNAQASFDRLTASSENFRITLGEAIRPLGTGIADALSQAAVTAQKLLAFIGAGVSATGSIITQTFERLKTTVQNIGNVIAGRPTQEIRSFGQILDEAGLIAIDRFKDIASTIEGVSFDDEPVRQLTDAFEDQEQAIGLSEDALKAYQSALEQAQSLQLSFARAAEDAARKLARANEDIARKQAQQVGKLEERQAKDRQKLLDRQVEQLKDFEEDRRKQIASAEEDIRKERQRASEQRKRDQQKLQRELRKAQERFDLSRLQSQRRFALSESRLRAEGDILGLKELREDFALQQQEEKENFDLSKKEQIGSAKEQQKEQEKDLDNRLNELKENLEDQRAELLTSFDEQLIAQKEQQAEALREQQRGFEEQAQERAIALAREEEDRRISQARQLEDLGISLANQKDITEEGVTAVAKEIEKVFGVEGVADDIIKGFTERTEGDFKGLFEELEEIVKDAKIDPVPIVPVAPVGPVPLPGAPRLGGEREFQEGGVIPGPVGSRQLVIAHGGETVLPTHQSSARGQFFRQALENQTFTDTFSRGTRQESFRMPAPVIPSQTLSVEMSGGFDIRGSDSVSREATQAAISEITESFRVAINRLARRN